ncbi:hypothetical protein RND71_015634 [Anisodus tanguticus]|uniref:Uncharacterized protein n=1 Tax=Anisodus tanguticus TaxID=243964 RepID=A0AAE1S6K2_9SOLA|nr:hypothetical protein RND71_015634 [Anisodus tanguticus]
MIDTLKDHVLTLFDEKYILELEKKELVATFTKVKEHVEDTQEEQKGMLKAVKEELHTEHERNKVLQEELYRASTMTSLALPGSFPVVSKTCRGSRYATGNSIIKFFIKAVLRQRKSLGRPKFLFPKTLNFEPRFPNLISTAGRLGRERLSRVLALNA